MGLNDVYHQVAFVVKNASKLRHEKKDKTLCAHGGLLGHTKDKCYKLHSYLLNYKKQGPAMV
ncbi:hypothetical protein HN51_022666 [Arachis hypogaea]